MTGKKWPKYLAVLVVLAMVSETMAFTLKSYAKNDSGIGYKLTDEDKITVSEISNMTGVRAEDIIRLREEGKTWNQILEAIKANPEYKVEEDLAKRNEILALSGIDEDAINRLKDEGFTEKEISEAKSLVDRMIFQLEEISGMHAIMPLVPEADDDLVAFTGLAKKINPCEAVYFILRLRDSLGGMQNAFDEYLCSLQLGIDLGLYLTDEEEYHRQKQQKTAETAMQSIITSSSIEDKMLDLLKNTNNRDEDIHEAKSITSDPADKPEESPLPHAEAPDARDVKPRNPAEAVMQEIEDIVNNGGSVKGR